MTTPEDVPGDIEPWECGGCGGMTTVTHWRSDADGVMFHAGPDAPPSDPHPGPDGRGHQG